MTAIVPSPSEIVIDVGVHLHARQWPGEREPYVLLHGLASNCRTWDGVAARLAAAGHPVLALDQRGHGLSDKPPAGYDFDSVSEDLRRVLEQLEWERPVLAGQSWGGTVVLQFAARQPGLARSLVCVDGGFIDLRLHPDPTWETISQQLRPPNLLGTPRTRIEAMIRTAHPDWDDAGVEATLANFETLADGTVRPWLPLERHMAIVRAMWEQDTPALFPRVREPVLLCVAEGGRMPREIHQQQIAVAAAGIPNCRVHRFPGADHDIHVQRPGELAEVMLEWVGKLGS